MTVALRHKSSISILVNVNPRIMRKQGHGCREGHRSHPSYRSLDTKIEDECFGLFDSFASFLGCSGFVHFMSVYIF